MKPLADFTADAWLWIVLWGVMLAIVMFAVLIVLLEYSKWRERRKTYRDDAESVKRLQETIDRLNEKFK
ncbi:hypothetical protein [Flavobacterium sp. NRK1]|uniref:hypothetical protein n=1 Tax=Flavobacterium sp. NRK1 TaxID=2954929 RepID=UPI0020931B26|nr:hypothetical protein [Flavobacterium sp. NRK1]MCO6149087.1 hypothetical protein [Flavobacterium sp. NRK1]